MKLTIVEYKNQPGEYKPKHFLILKSENGEPYFPTYNQIFKGPAGMFAAKTNLKDRPWTEFIIISGSLPSDFIYEYHQKT